MAELLRTFPLLSRPAPRAGAAAGVHRFHQDIRQSVLKACIKSKAARSGLFDSLKLNARSRPEAASLNWRDQRGASPTRRFALPFPGCLGHRSRVTISRGAELRAPGLSILGMVLLPSGEGQTVFALSTTGYDRAGAEYAMISTYCRPLHLAVSQASSRKVARARLDKGVGPSRIPHRRAIAI